MKTTQYLKILFCLFWNMIAFLCPIISYKNFADVKLYTCYYFQHVNKHFLAILYNFKEIINKKILKNKNNSTAETLAVVNPINKTKSSKSNRAVFSKIKTNQALKNLNPFYINKLKDALATQILISNSKQHFIPLGAMVVVYQSLLLQLDLSCIKACSDDLKKVMTITEDKCAFLYPFLSKNHCSLYNL